MNRLAIGTCICTETMLNDQVTHCKNCFDWPGKETPFVGVFLLPNTPEYARRSNVAQQRVSAIASIAGLLNIYNQGFYDAVLEIPISKIFFLLRFAFDDNVPALLEVTSKALATLFHNDSDEVIAVLFRKLCQSTNDCVLDFIGFYI